MISSLDYRCFKRLLLSVLCLALVACVSTEHIVQVDVSDITDIVEVEEQFPVLIDALFGEPIVVEQPDEILKLSSEQIIDFDKYANKFGNREFKSHEKVFRYLQDISPDFKYKDVTYTADHTLETKTGNCMSLAVLTAALANYSDVKIEYQLVNRLPIYQESGGIVFNARHIKTALFEPVMDANMGIQIFRGYAVVDYYPSRFNYVDGIVSEDGFFAMYYRNRSAEELAAGEYKRSYYYLLESLKYEPEHEEAINNLAVLHRRIGEEKKAEDLYLYGIKHAKNKLSLLRNYKAMLSLQGRIDEVAVVQSKLDQYDDENPFEWVKAGNDAFDQKDYVIAKTFFEKAAEKAPYLHQAHYGVAKVEYMLGNPRATKNALDKALKEAFDEESKTVYEAKLEALSRERLN